MGPPVVIFQGTLALTCVNLFLHEYLKIDNAHFKQTISDRSGRGKGEHSVSTFVGFKYFLYGTLSSKIEAKVSQFK